MSDSSKEDGATWSPVLADYPGQVSQTWEPGAYGVMALPSGRLIRGRGLRIDNPYKPDPALACLAVLDGAPAAGGVAYVRQHYSPDAIETPEQASFVADFH